MFTNSTAKNVSFSPSQETIMKLNSFILASGANKVKYGKNKDQDLSPDTDAAIQRSSMAYNAMLKMKIRNEIKLSINNLTYIKIFGIINIKRKREKGVKKSKWQK